MRTEIGQVIKLEDYKPTDFIIKTVDLSFILDPSATRVKSTISVQRRNGVAISTPIRLDGEEMLLLGISIDGNEISPFDYQTDASSLTIHNLPSSDTFSIEISTEIAPAKNTKLMGLFQTSNVYCTQCEAEGFRRITYFYDRPDVLAIYTTRIEADKKLVPLLLSNGNLTESGDLKDGRHFAVWNDPHPKPSYLFALVGGDLGVIEDEFITCSGRKVALKIYVEHGKEPRAAYSMDALKRSMEWDERVFGCEYDLDIFMIVAVSDFNMGAMENKGLNVFNDKFVLAAPETATDSDYARIEAIIAHEYFHNWTGNRITCRDWFQLCLKEGLTVFRDHEFSADQRSRSVKRIEEVRLLMAHQFPEDAGPLSHPPRPSEFKEINNFYTATVYEKGSEVVRMLQTILGKQGFRKGMDLYFQRHDGDAATIEDFIHVFEDANSIDLSQFAFWYYEAGTPMVSVETSYDEAGSTFTIDLVQTIPTLPGAALKQPRLIPLAYALYDSDGNEMNSENFVGARIQHQTILLEQESQKIVFSNIKSHPVLSINRGFSAPINLNFSRALNDDALIAQYDSDLFSRWQACNKIATKAIICEVNNDNSAHSKALKKALIEALKKTVNDESLEPAFVAAAITLPSEGDIAREIAANVNPQAIFDAITHIRTLISEQLNDDFERAFSKIELTGDYDPCAEDAGKRALKLRALDYISWNKNSPDLVYSAFQTADNMSEKSHMLSHLAHSYPSSLQAQTALSDFEKEYSSDPLVIDKWFTIQATIPGRTTLALVKELMQSKHFSLTNPNRVRSLIGVFATANQTGFHLENGDGYTFFADLIIKIDAINPQLAARLLTIMRSWKSLESVRKAHAKNALAQIFKTKKLSSDVSDIVARILNG